MSFRNPPHSSDEIQLKGTTTKLSDWQHPSDLTKIDGSKLYPGTVTTDKIADGAITTEKIADYAVTESKIATGALAAYQLVKFGKVSSLPDTDTEIAHNLGYVPSLVLVWPGYDSGVFGYVAVKSITASSFIARASVSGVDLWYAIFK